MVNAACARYTTLFNDEHEAVWFFNLGDKISGNGRYTFSTVHGGEGTLDVVWNRTGYTDETGLYEEFMQSVVVFAATMAGTEGKVRVLAFAMESEQYFGETGSKMIVIRDLTEEQLTQYNTLSRLQSGARIQNLITGTSKLIESGHSNIAEIGYESDLSTLYILSGDSSPGPTTGDCDCVCLANKALDIARKAIEQTYDACVKNIMLAYAAAMAACIAGGLVPAIGWIASAFCMAGATATMVFGLTGCSDAADIANTAALASYRLALDACGVIIAEV